MPKLRNLALLAAGVGATMAVSRRVAHAPADLAVAARAEAASRSGPWTHGYKVANRMKLHYAEMGNRAMPLVVLLHGFPECWYEWRHVMPKLAERFHVVAPDMRGYNWSERPRGVSNYSVDKVAADIAALIRELGYERAHVVGHDWGGAVSWYFGANNADRLDKLVVINAPHPGPFKRELLRGKQLLLSYYIFLFQLPLIPEAITRLSIRAGLTSTATAPGAFTGDALDVYQNMVSQPGAATAMINYYRAFFRDALRLSRTGTTVRRPTMVIWGMKDFALVPQLVDGLERWVPDLRVKRVPDSGHWVPEEKPHLVADTLMEFLLR